MQPDSPRGGGFRALILTLIATAVVADLALWIFARMPDPYAHFAEMHPHVNQYIRLEYPRHYAAITMAEDGLPGVHGRNRFTTNNMGFRGPALQAPKPAGEYRIFFVGGSTTECFYLDDKDDMSAVLARRLNAQAPPGTTFAVYNAGLSGAASDDHVAMITQRLVQLEPDMIIVFCGINDLTRSILHYDYLHYVDVGPAYQKPWYKRLAMRSQIARRIYYLWHNVTMDEREVQEQRPLKSSYAGKIGLQKTVPPTDRTPRTDIPPYAGNLETLVGVAEAHGFELVFMTQQTTWNSDVDPRAKDHQWMRLRGGVTYREDKMDAAMEQLNDAMRGVARTYRIPVFDTARQIPKSLDYFYDDCHFNVNGAATTAEELAAFLAGATTIPRAPAAGESH